MYRSLKSGERGLWGAMVDGGGGVTLSMACDELPAGFSAS